MSKDRIEILKNMSAKSVTTDAQSTETQDASPVNSQDQISTPSNEPVSTESTPSYDFNDFNEKYGKKFGLEVKEEKDLTSLFEAPKKISEYEKRVTEHETNYNKTKKELEELTKKYNDTARFVDPKTLIAPSLITANQMIRKYPDKDPSLMFEISKMDVDKASAVDLIRTKELLENADVYKGLSVEEANEVMTSKYGVDFNDSDNWSKVDKAKIDIASKPIRNEFKQYQTVEADAPIDIEKLKADMLSEETTRYEKGKNEWTPLINKMLSDNLKELSIAGKDGKEIVKISPELAADFKAEALNQIEFMARTGQPVNESTIDRVLMGLKAFHFYNNRSEIATAILTKAYADKDAEYHNKLHNDAPLSNAVNPASNADSEDKANRQKLTQARKFMY